MLSYPLQACRLGSDHLESDRSRSERWVFTATPEYHVATATVDVNLQLAARDLPFTLEQAAFVLDGERLGPARLRGTVVGLLCAPGAALLPWAQGDLDTASYEPAGTGRPGACMRLG